MEKIYQSILNLISNLFEGPLLSIQDAVKDLKKSELHASSNNVIQPIEQISISSDSLTHILDNISAMVNLSAGLTPVNRIKNNIEELITACYDKVKQSMTNYCWVVRIEDNLPEILFDYDLIELLFYNLAFHAIEFAPPESTIEVEAKQNGDYVTVSLAGEGQIIPEEMVDVVFEKFYRLSAMTPDVTQSRGLGLGLAIAKTIAEIHNGHLTVKSRPKGGTIFCLFLPVEN